MKLSALDSLRSSTGGLAGRFTPQVYSLSLPRRVVEDLNHIDDIGEFVGKCSREQERCILAFAHEMNHLMTFLSTSFGYGALVSLDTSILTYIANSGQPIPIPVPWLGIEHQPYRTATDTFDYYFNVELNPKQIPSSDSAIKLNEKIGNELYKSVIFPLSLKPLVTAFPPEIRSATGLDDELFASGETTLVSGHHPKNVLYQHWYRSESTGDGEAYENLNAAALFEALAILTELQIVLPRVSGDFRAFLDAMLDTLAPVYTCAIRVFLDVTGLRAEEVLITLPAVIDLALMQDALGLYGSGPFDAVKHRAYRSPADYFLEALPAVRELGGFGEFWANGWDRKHSFHEACQRYQDKLAAHLKYTKTTDAARLAIKRLLGTAPIGTFSETTVKLEDRDILAIELDPSIFHVPGTIDNRVPAALHFWYLRKRAFTKGYFAQLMTFKTLQSEFGGIHDQIFLVDVETNQLLNEGETKTQTMCAPALQALVQSQRSAKCPFQSGEPFFCRSSEGDFFCLTFTPDNARIHMCPFYMLGTRLADPPGDAKLVEAAREVDPFDRGSVFYVSAVNRRTFKIKKPPNSEEAT